MDETEGCYSTLYNGKNSPDSAHKEWRGALKETWPAWPETWQDKGQCGCQTFLFDHSYNLGRRPLYSRLVSCFVKAAGIWKSKSLLWLILVKPKAQALRAWQYRLKLKHCFLFLFSPTNTPHLSHQLQSIPPLAPAEIVRYWSML